ncbi:PAS domain S-box protein [candidate division CSSED10-310 bacterium]|uniref:PAS domain S-box protein n=1 Tax=candidate division CSSED10-310 bacterium TaxID=2855610 RepID=A0ABV6Z166_UNCC1
MIESFPIQSEQHSNNDTYKVLLDSLNEAIFIADPGSRQLLDCNRKAEQLTGFRKEQIDKLHGAQNFAWPTSAYQDCDADNLLVVETDIVARDGRQIPVEVNPSLVNFQGKELLITFVRDISERKQAEEKIRNSEEKFRTIFENVHDALIYLDHQGKIIDVNEKAINLYGGSRHELLDRHFTKIGIFSPQDEPELVRKFTHAFQEEKLSLDLSINNKKGQTIHLECSMTRIKNEKLVVTARDVTARKKVAQKLESSLDEKEILLKEIHHRVKNNMQIISSLLNLQARRVQNEEIQGMFIESQHRIQSMSLIHEQLYQSKDFSSIDLGKYIRNLVKSLYSSYGINSNRIKPVIAVRDVTLDIDTAIPCGLIINELVSNTLKYAFPEHKTGEIRIMMQTRNHEEHELVVQDDGIGLPADMDISNSPTMGLYIVHLLSTRQLKGQVAMDRAKGTQFTITFSKQNHYQ